METQFPKSREWLEQHAREAEEAAWYPEGRPVDGAPYSYLAVFSTDPEADFLLRSVSSFGREQLRKQVLEMRGDQRCANWMLWASFCLLGVARVTE